MITSASGYECLDVTGLESFIDGSIMPVREAREDGSWRCLKYEDLLFLHEAWRERLAALDGEVPSSLENPYGRMLKKEKIYAIANGICMVPNHAQSGGWKYVTADVELPTSVTMVQQRNIMEALGISYVEQLTTPGVPEAKLDAEYMQNAYRNIKRYSRTAISINPVVAGKQEGWGHDVNNRWTKSYSVDVEATGEMMWRKTSSRNWANYIICNSDRVETKNAVWVKSAKAFAMYVGSNNNNNKQAIRPVACEAVGDGVVSVRVGAMNEQSVLKEMAEQMGIMYIAPGSVPMASGEGSIGLQGILLVVDHEFPATPPEEG